MVTTYVIISGIMFIMLAIIWSSHGYANAFMKTFFIIMAIFSVVVLLSQMFAGVNPALANGMRLW